MTEEQEIVDYIHSVIYSKENSDGKSRKRIFLDPRNYLIAVLYYKYRYTEEQIAYKVKRDRCTIHSAKTKPYDYRNREDFLRHTIDVRSKFPYIFPDPQSFDEQYNKIYKPIMLRVHMSQTTFQKLNKYREVNELFDVSSAALDLIKKQLENE